MSLNTLQDIERAINTLPSHELEELYGWLDQRVHPLDSRIQSDLMAGRLDDLIQSALDDEQSGRVQPL